MNHRPDSSKDRIFAGIFSILVINNQLILPIVIGSFLLSILTNLPVHDQTSKMNCACADPESFVRGGPDFFS